MTELLFKLKLAGKCVGYMRIVGGKIWVRHVGDPDSKWMSQFWPGRIRIETEIYFDSIHPFVCQDRRGRDVFEGDQVIQAGRHCYVKWDPADLGWCLRDLAGEQPPLMPEPLDIELVKEGAQP